MNPPATLEPLLDAFTKQPTGSSTLDLLQRLPAASDPLRHVNANVRAEMLMLAAAPGNLPPDRKHTVLQIGERLDRPQQKYVPGTPITRKLKGGRFVRMDGKDGLYERGGSLLGSCSSSPDLGTTVKQHRVLACHLSNNDSLDLAVQRHSPQCTQKEKRVDANAQGDPKITQLKQQQTKLEEELLHVTKKLCRKYSKQLFSSTTDPSVNKTKQLAAQWNTQAISGQTESERYGTYMAGRYTTQTQMDYYAHELEPRDASNSNYRHHSEHTKYGDTLALNKKSLRGRF